MIGKNSLNSLGRRRFLEAAAGAFAITQIVRGRAAHARLILDSSITVAQSETPDSFSALKQIDAGVLNVGCIEAGPIDGPVAILLHGWAYGIHSFGEVTPCLASAGFRVIVPYARGYGFTNFLSNETPRTGQPSALAVDTIALMDALNIKQATLAGFDWGARTADISGALWPDRVKGIVSVSGYLIGSQEAGRMPLPPRAELQWWCQYYFATERGREGYEKYRRKFAELVWRLASPRWKFDDATFSRSAAAFDNPDHVDIVIHNSMVARRRSGRSRPRCVGGEVGGRAADQRASNHPRGRDDNGAPHPDPAAYAKKFSGKYLHRLVEGGVGHNFPQEAPEPFSQAVIDVSKISRKQICIRSKRHEKSHPSIGSNDGRP